MNILPVVYQIIMLFIIAGIGLLLRAKKIFTDPVIKGINTTILMVTWPAMMLMTTQREYSPEVLPGFLTVLFGSIIILSIAVICAFLIFRKSADMRLAPVLTMLAVMPNAGYIGLPIVQAVYGDSASVFLAAYITGFNIVLWTVCSTMYNGLSAKAMRGILSPGFICSILGIFFFLSRITLPTPLLSTVNQLGGLNTPLSMLLVGARMDTLRFHHLKDGKMWISVLCKLLVFPITVLLIAKLLGISGLPLGILALCSAMPSASATQMFAEKHDARVDVAAKGVSIATLACIASIPIMLLLIGA